LLFVLSDCRVVSNGISGGELFYAGAYVCEKNSGSGRMNRRARFRAIYKLPLFQASSSLYSALSRFINSLHLGDMDKPQTSAHNIMSKCE